MPTESRPGVRSELSLPMYGMIGSSLEDSARSFISRSSIVAICQKVNAFSLDGWR